MPSTMMRPRVAGVIVRGHGRGRDLGYPTANVAVADGEVPALEGIYAAWFRVAGGSWRAATVSWGVNPTFEDVVAPVVEAYVHDHEGSLYGHSAEVEFVARLRPNVRFATVAALTAQAAEDVSAARLVLQEQTPGTASVS